MQQSRMITKRSGSNLTPALLVLSREKRDAMSALYAFCRAVDDVADDESRPIEQRRDLLAQWRADIRRACEGDMPEMITNREFQPAILRYSLRFDLFDQLICGCEMDLGTTRYATYEDLDVYCYRVASVVGLLSIEIFGYASPSTRDYAIALGKALQVTNILRDVGNDAVRGRIYLPQNELARFGVDPADILAGVYTPQFCDMAKSVAHRARDYYRSARETLPEMDRRKMAAAELMGMVYWRLLLKIERTRFQVLRPTPIRLSKAVKLALVARFWFGFATHSTANRYGPAPDVQAA
jgi:phytoene synthase